MKDAVSEVLGRKLDVELPPDVREAIARAGAKAIAIHEEEMSALKNRISDLREGKLTVRCAP